MHARQLVCSLHQILQRASVVWGKGGGGLVLTGVLTQRVPKLTDLKSLLFLHLQQRKTVLGSSRRHGDQDSHGGPRLSRGTKTLAPGSAAEDSRKKKRIKDAYSEASIRSAGTVCSSDVRHRAVPLSREFTFILSLPQKQSKYTLCKSPPPGDSRMNRKFFVVCCSWQKERRGTKYRRNFMYDILMKRQHLNGVL